ncbi:hypothetical protein JCM8097_000519 [Rhodosporidiobolus ruineniae]
MNRFRRKSTSKSAKSKGKERAGSGSSDRSAVEGGGAEPMARSGSTASLLPEPSDFRTSLLLPQMMKRFSLLRGVDGQLVDMETMQSHLAQQRQTGRLTAYEVDAVLAQYKLQSAYKSPTSPTPSLPKRKRIDWSKIQQAGGIEEESEAASTTGGFESMRTSFATTSGEDHTSHSMAPSSSQQSAQSAHRSPTSPFSPSPSGSTISFPTSSSPASGSPNPSSSSHGAGQSAYPYQFRRNPNSSMFGSRAHASREMKMLKSGSSQSIASLGGSVRSRKGSVAEGQEEDAEEPSTPELETPGGEEDAAVEENVVAAEEDGADVTPTDAFADADEPDRAASPASNRSVPSPAPRAEPSSSATLSLPELSTKQLRRISHALDDIETELSKTFAKLASSTLAEDEGGEEDGAEAARRALKGERDEDDRQDEEEGTPMAADEELPTSPVEVEDSASVKEAERPPSPIVEERKEAARAELDQGLQLDQDLQLDQGLQLDLDFDDRRPSADDSASPTSPISPVTESDLQGLSTFALPSFASEPDSASSVELDPASPVEPRSPSPAMSDTEPVDPFYLRLQQQAARVPLPPSIASSSPSLPLSAGASPVISSATSSPLVAFDAYERSPSASPNLATSPPSHFSPQLPDAPADISPSEALSAQPSDTVLAPSSPSAPSLSPLAIPLRPHRLRELSVETDDASTATPSGSSPSTPAAFTFPFLPSRTDSGVTARPRTAETTATSEGVSEVLDETEEDGEESRSADRTATDEGPFDLSLGGIRIPPEVAAADEEELPTRMDEEREAEEKPVEAREDEQEARQRTESASSADSKGSSFHDTGVALTDSDEELLADLTAPSSTTHDHSRPHSLPIASSSDPLSDSPTSTHLRPFSVPLDRRPSNELLQVLAEASPRGDGDADMAYEDLLAIQETLVRVAARRAARLGSNDSSEGGAAATPSSIASSSMAEPFSLSGVAAFARTPHPETESLNPARKGSVESAVTPSIPDMTSQLAGLGLTSVAPFDLSQPAPALSAAQSQRASRRTSASGRRDSRRASEHRRRSERRWSVEDEAGARDSGLLGPASSRMTAQTSQASSMSPGQAVTPSTNQSDAFEFSSLVGSPETQSWEDAQEHLREDSITSGSPLVDDLSSSVPPSRNSDDGERDEQFDEQLAADEDAVEEDDELEPLPEGLATAVTSPQLDSAAPIDTDSFLRVPRKLAPRDPSKTTSMLVRDVRNQATLATIALKKKGGPTSPPPSKPLSKSKSIRKGSISSPQLVSGPIAIPAVPILNPEVSESLRSSKMGRSKSRSDKEKEREGDSRKGLGLRFKMLLKKPTSRDQLGHLNGDEVTPFVDFDPAAEERKSTSASAPITPPNQDVARFDSPSSFPRTPDDAPTPSHSRSPSHSQANLNLPTVKETLERAPSAASNASRSPSIGSPQSASGSTNSRSLSRIMSRIRSSGRRESDTSSFAQEKESLRDSATSPERTTSPYQSPKLRPYSPQTVDRRPSLDQEVIGLGFGGPDERAGRAPTSYQVGSPRARHRFEQQDTYEVPSTAPLSVNKQQQDLAAAASFTFPPNRSNGHAPRASIDSMRKLWQAAEDLGLPPDKVQELVDSAYAQSPTTSSHAHSGSTSSTVGRRSTEQTRRPSESEGHRRAGSASSRKAVPALAATPPSASRHHRKTSSTSSRYAAPVPEHPSTYSSPPQQDGSRLSVYSTSAGPSTSLAVPHSPSLGSLASRKSSEYANSFINFYAGGEDDEYSQPPLPSPPLFGRRPSLTPSVDEQLAMQQRLYDEEQQQQNTVRLNPIGEFEEQHRGADFGHGSPAAGSGDEVVWQVLDDLRQNRLSMVSKSSGSFGFNSRHSSFEVEPTNEGERADAIANLLRHRDRKRLSTGIPPWQQGRYPSIYAADESRLLALGEQGGIARDAEGHFFVRPKEEDQPPPEVPQVPEEFRGQRVGRY